VAFEPDAAALPWLELTRTLLLSAALQRSAEARHDSSALTALLAEWLAGPQAAQVLEPRLNAAGIGGAAPYLVAVAEVGSRLAAGRAAQARRFHQLEQVRQAGEEYFRTLGYGVLSETRSYHCVWVFAVQAPRQHARLLLNAAEAAAGDADVRLGVSLPREDLTGVADAYHQALLALQALPGGSGLAWFDELDPVYWVLQQQPHGNLVALRDRLVGSVKSADPHGRLWRTLVAYIRSPEDLQALARQLHVHVNTLRYRLKRIEELVQEPLGRPETIAKLYLALQIDAMLERGGAQE
jgi:DNA-binding PucR family transcriptional regulator